MKNKKIGYIVLFIFISIIIFNSSTLSTFLRYVLREAPVDDFWQYYIGSSCMRHGVNIYDQTEYRAHLSPEILKLLIPCGRNICPSAPVLYFFYMPLTYLDLLVARKVYFFVNMILLFAAIAIIVKIFYAFFRVGKKEMPANAVLFFLASLFFLPVMEAFGQGQCDIANLLCICLTVYFFLRKREILSGLFLALAISIKLFPIVFLLYFLYRRQYRLVLSCILSGILLNGAVSLLFSPGLFLSYPISLIFYKDFSFTSYYLIDTMQSISALMDAVWGNWLLSETRRLFPWVVKASYLLIAGIIVIMTSCLFRIKEKRFETNVLFELIIISILQHLIFPYSSCHHHTVTLISFYLIFLYFCYSEKSDRKQMLFFSIIAIIYTFLSLFDGPYLCDDRFLAALRYNISMHRYPSLFMLFYFMALWYGYRGKIIQSEVSAGRQDISVQADSSK